MHVSVFCSLGAKKVLGSFGGEFRSTQAKMEWKHLRGSYAHDSLHYLLPCKGGFAYVYACSVQLDV